MKLSRCAIVYVIVEKCAQKTLGRRFFRNHHVTQFLLMPRQNITANLSAARSQIVMSFYLSSSLIQSEPNLTEGQLPEEEAKETSIAECRPSIESGRTPLPEMAVAA